ncbi:MAG: hypothetical protein NC541_08230 [bacterium]|nr:hypothetical protein [bacterium]
MGEVMIVASFSQVISNKYGTKTYQDTKNTYDWIMKALNTGEFQGLKVNTNFWFDISEITYSCENIEEYVEYAYGQNDYSFTAMDFQIESSGISTWFIHVQTDSKISISTDTKNLLEKIVVLLRNTSLDETEKDAPISVTLIEHQDNSVTINGNSNVVANNHSVVTDKQEKSKSKISGWLQGISQGILANLVWWVLGLVVAMLLGWAISKGYIGI